jgi:transposase
MKGLIALSKKEAHRVEVMEQVVLGRIGLKMASQLLDLSYRQSRRIKTRYSALGIAGLCHGNRGKQSANAMDPAVRSRILSLHEDRYSGLNDSHFTELLAQREGIGVSRESVRRILRSAGKGPKRKRRPPKHRSRRPRKPTPGIMAQWDGSPHRWFGPNHPPVCLMAAVDDADGKLLGALFIAAESSEGYLRLLAMMLRRHGVCLSIYHDRHSSLVRNDDHWSREEQLQGYQYPTHVGRVLEELGVASIPANSPQAKGRIERKFGVLQDRMIEDMRLEGIVGVQAANRWIEETYIARHNAKFGKEPSGEGSAFRKISARQIHHIVCFAYEATVGNDNCVRLGGLLIDIPKGKGGVSYAKKRVLVRQHLDGTWSVWLGDEKIGSHNATEFKEPVRSWKSRNGEAAGKRGETMQVYVSSKPAPRTKGHFPVAVKGTD